MTADDIICRLLGEVRSERRGLQEHNPASPLPEHTDSQPQVRLNLSPFSLANLERIGRAVCIAFHQPSAAFAIGPIPETINPNLLSSLIAFLSHPRLSFKRLQAAYLLVIMASFLNQTG